MTKGLQSHIKIEADGFEEADALLAKLPATLRLKSLGKALGAAATIVVKEAKRKVPQPGYQGDKPQFKPLRDTIKKKKYTAGTVVMYMVGPSWPDGAHGWLVEHGHKIKRTTPGPDRTRPTQFLERAADSTKSLQHNAVVKKLRQEIDKLA